MAHNDASRGQVNTAAAEIYENFFVPALFGAWPAQLLATADVKPGHRVLDVACGTGIVARHAAKLVGSPDRVTGVDINDGMLAVAAKGAPDINWVKAPAEELPFEDECFDVVTCQFSLMFFDDRTRALKEMHRVLKSGGKLAVATWDNLDHSPGYRDMVALLNQLFGRTVADALRAPFTLGSVDDVNDEFARAGIRSTTVATLPGKARFASLEDWITTDVKGWTLGDLIDDSQFDTLKQQAKSALAAYVDSDGRVEFDAPAHIVTVQK